MFAPRITTVFRSRWRALWWSASIMGLAYCSMPAPEDTPHPAKADAPHASPWDKK